MLVSAVSAVSTVQPPIRYWGGHHMQSRNQLNDIREQR